MGVKHSNIDKYINSNVLQVGLVKQLGPTINDINHYTSFGASTTYEMVSEKYDRYD
ncbi:hypothetical protein [Psychrobacter piechaudii]|uniref:hypothetical protein n=1 Tax=Psychrobacter piechaudii TaxID=1945521 RepID=UPI001428B2C9|nr:hypothetical protein [Psychrobacter piechaudii]